VLAEIKLVTYFLSSLTGLVVAGNRFPPMNRWAIFFRPAGLGKRHRTYAQLPLGTTSGPSGPILPRALGLNACGSAAEQAPWPDAESGTWLDAERAFGLDVKLVPGLDAELGSPPDAGSSSWLDAGRAPWLDAEPGAWFDV
jgi:hypothetical protein